MSAEVRRHIETPVGKVWGRDAIHLDSFSDSFDQKGLQFSGELNAALCSGYRGEAEWIGCDLSFTGVRAFQCWELEVYPHMPKFVSSFDIVENSTWLSYLSEVSSKDESVLALRHYVLATYDYVYEIAASNYELQLGKERAG